MRNALSDKTAPVSAAGFGRPARVDAVGDFLETYAGPKNGDLDVVVADARLTRADEVVLRGVHAGPIGTTEGAAYVWGIDRGAGTELFPTLHPPTGARARTGPRVGAADEGISPLRPGTAGGRAAFVRMEARVNRGRRRMGNPRR